MYRNYADFLTRVNKSNLKSLLPLLFSREGGGDEFVIMLSVTTSPLAPLLVGEGELGPIVVNLRLLDM